MIERKMEIDGPWYGNRK